MGEDRARLIHALSTNHVQEMTPGDQRYAFFLTAQGRILFDCHIACFEDHLLLDAEPEVRETVIKHIDHYVIADDVTLEDVTGITFSLLAAGRRIYGELADKARTIEQLGLVPATSEDLEAFRIGKYHPKFGIDFHSTTLPQETGLGYALHFNKGCYLGQEIVERIRSRGHVNKVLAGLRSQDGEPLAAGWPVLFDGQEAGQITSASNGSAIAMLRVPAAKPGTVVQAGTVTAQVHAVT
jgi:aminomethyltransferase